MVRHKNRYIVVQIGLLYTKENTLMKIPHELIALSIKEKVQQLHGDFGEAAIRAGFTAKYCNEYTRIAIIRVRHGPHRLVTSSIPFIRKLNKIKVSMSILYIGATIRKCFSFIKQYQEQSFEKMCDQYKTPEELEAIRNVITDFEKILKSI
ncbi:POP5 ribonuclease P/MRP subunit [Rhynchophorus ferrugineus]|uniref:Ribonuclease P/MRP protein subunit POP5 n=1 Tax=Rhynchophorus ferrugineus TaxID=354439 RepID=A0A834MJ02_RHYFE|nr:hypothetical protein GWI33_010404 [Rhynchophorus ferrugineus]